MGDKSIQKRRYIIEKAAKVFGEKGYKNVTMKDIVEACDISRGGLYLYFNSTKELFEAVLESLYPFSVIEQSADILPGDRLLAFLEERKQEIVYAKDYIMTAVYEYMFEHKDMVMEGTLLTSFDACVNCLEKIIRDGVEAEWMECEEPQAAAKSIMYTIEGLKVSAQIRVVTADMVDKEIEYIMGTLGLALE